MGAFLLRRLWQSAILLVAVTILVFVIVLAAGDPVRGAAADRRCPI